MVSHITPLNGPSCGLRYNYTASLMPLRLAHLFAVQREAGLEVILAWENRVHAKDCILAEPQVIHENVHDALLFDGLFESNTSD